MPNDLFGPPQFAALMILVQRGLEEVHSQRNTRRLLAEGGTEVGREYYPVVAVTHLAWISSLAFLIPSGATLYILPLAAFLLLQPVRYWIIGTLGRFWTHRILTLPSAPIVAAGPYGFVRHPNYVVTVAETLLLPLAFGQPALAVIMTAVWWVVLRYKVGLEDQALAARRVPGPAPA